MKTASKNFLALLMMAAGVMHFLNPGFYLKIMPPYIPCHRELVFLSGAIEVVLGVLLLMPPTTKIAAWGIIGLLIAVFPANLYLYSNQDLIPAPAVVHFLRLPLQAVFIFWAYQYTKSQQPVPQQIKKNTSSDR